MITAVLRSCVGGPVFAFVVSRRVSEKAGRVLRGGRMRYAPFSSVTEGDWKVYLEDMRSFQTPPHHVDIRTRPIRSARNGENRPPQARRTMGQSGSICADTSCLQVGLLLGVHAHHRRRIVRRILSPVQNPPFPVQIPVESSLRSSASPVLTLRNLTRTHSLTPPVLAETLARPTALVIAYHPPLFKPVSRLTLGTHLHSALLRLAAEGVSVYSPHSALDSAKGGINDWLVEGVVPAPGGGKEAEVSYLDGPIREQDEGGKGRLIVLHDSVPIEELVSRIKRHLGIDYGKLSLVPLHTCIPFLDPRPPL